MRTVKKPSKKTRCPCGSKQRYASCCRKKDIELTALLANLRDKIDRDDLDRRKFTTRYGHVRRPIGVEVNGKIFSAFDGAIYQQTQEGSYNFLNALHDHALHFFGDEVLLLEESKPVEDRHPALRWMYEHIESSSNCKQDGNGAAWFRFAYDLFTIRDNAKLERALRARLRTASSFQSARYELKVAAICAAAGFDLQFEDEVDNRVKHPEFTGTERSTGVRIAVEVKSRHRRGVLGFSGGRDVDPGAAVDIRKNVLEAYKKQSELPLYVFIDVNLPPASAAMMQRWESELQATMLDLDAEGYASPCPANAVFFTNDPSHYVGRGRIGSSDNALWVRTYTATIPAVPHPDRDMVQRLMTAHSQRVAPPTNFYESP